MTLRITNQYTPNQNPNSSVIHLNDKLTKYLEEMEKKGMLEKEKSITITEKGMEFHKDYSRINELINEMNEKTFARWKLKNPYWWKHSGFN